MLPTGIDGDADDEGASDGGEDLASDSDDDEAEKKRKEKKRELRARASSWPRLGDSEHRDRVHKCREYVLAHERRYRAREEAERVALANARKVRNEDVARRKLFARAKTHPWEFLDANDPDGSKAERKRRNRRVVRKPGASRCRRSACACDPASRRDTLLVYLFNTHYEKPNRGQVEISA